MSTNPSKTIVEHDLKVWPEFYEQLDNGSKTFEVRKDDRGFRVGHVLLLREWNPRMEEYTGRLMRREVSYLMCGPLFGLERGYVAMALGRRIEIPHASENTSPLRELLERLARDLDIGAKSKVLTLAEIQPTLAGWAMQIRDTLAQTPHETKDG